VTTGIRARLCLAMASSKVTDPRPSDDQPKKRSKSAERVALETGVGELKLNVADVNGLS